MENNKNTRKTISKLSLNRNRKASPSTSRSGNHPTPSGAPKGFDINENSTTANTRPTKSHVRTTQSGKFSRPVRNSRPSPSSQSSNPSRHHHTARNSKPIHKLSRKLRRMPSLKDTLRQKRNKTKMENQRTIRPIPPVGDNIRIIPIGGVEEIGKNMIAVEIGNDIIVLDAGFQFKDATTPGIDYILPNTEYLEKNKHKVRGLFITHGHLDHIGAIPYIIEKIGNPPIYTRQFGAIMIKKKLAEFPHVKNVDIRIVDGDEVITVGNLTVETFSISHTIPDSMGIIINTKYGDIVMVEDVRVDNIDGIPTEEEVEQWSRFKDRNVLFLSMDSTSIEKPGFSISEDVVVENIEKIIKETSSRLIIGTFASQVERIIEIIKIADKYGKKIIFEGRSMKNNMEIVKQLKLVKTDNVIPVSEMEEYPPDRIVMLVTGAQGEEFAALMRMANKSHKYVKLRKTDTILLSASIIPVNFASVIRLKDALYKSEAKIITYLDSDVHASGHGNRGELSWIHKQIPYKFFMPVHGFHYFLRQHAEVAESLGTPAENIIVPSNGSIIEIQEDGKKIVKLPMMVPHSQVTVDGHAIGTTQDVVLEDRQILSEAGIFMVVAVINVRAKRLKKSPDIISRGFIYLRESQDLLQQARNITKKSIEDNLRKNKEPKINFDKLKKDLTEELTHFLFNETGKQPLIIPVINGV